MAPGQLAKIPIKTEIFATLIAEFRKTIFKMVKATTAYTPARDD
jgi:hypothetical protein